MKTLYLLRHARAGPAGDDHERPLAADGVRHAAKLAGHLARQRFAPNVVLCSSARRALETLEPLRPRLATNAHVFVERGLYLAAPGELLDRIAEVDDDAPALLLVAHNPGIAELAHSLAEAGAVTALRRGVAAGTLIELHFDTARWHDLRLGGAHLAAFTAPGDVP